MDAKAVADGDTITVYVSTMDPRESSCVPGDVQVAAVQRSKARAAKNYAKADALHKQIVDAGYRLVISQKFYRIFHLAVIPDYCSTDQCDLLLQSTNDSK